jgi:hypothetical protein
MSRLSTASILSGYTVESFQRKPSPAHCCATLLAHDDVVACKVPGIRILTSRSAERVALLTQISAPGFPSATKKLTAADVTPTLPLRQLDYKMHRVCLIAVQTAQARRRLAVPPTWHPG